MIGNNFEKDDDVAAVASISKQLPEFCIFKGIRLDKYKEFSEILKIKYDNNEKEINKKRKL